MTQNIQEDVIHYLFLSQFRQPPSVVDEMDYEKVSNILYIHQLVKEKEEKMIKENNHD